MKKLLQFEFRKLFKQKSTYICFALLMLIAILDAVVGKYLPLGTINGEWLESVTTANITAYAVAPMMFYPLFIIVLCVFVSLYCCGDRSNGTIKNVHAKGYTRMQVYFTKYIVSIIFTLVATIMAFVLAFLTGLILTKAANGINGKLFINILCQVLIIIASHAIMFCVANRFTKSGGSMAVNILIQIFVPVAITLLDSFVALMISPSFHFAYFFPTSILNYMPAINIQNSFYIASAVTSVVYTAIFIPLGMLSVRKREY